MKKGRRESVRQRHNPAPSFSWKIKAIIALYIMKSLSIFVVNTSEKKMNHVYVVVHAMQSIYMLIAGHSTCHVVTVRSVQHCAGEWPTFCTFQFNSPSKSSDITTTQLQNGGLHHLCIISTIWCAACRTSSQHASACNTKVLYVQCRHAQPQCTSCTMVPATTFLFEHVLQARFAECMHYRVHLCGLLASC